MLFRLGGKPRCAHGQGISLPGTFDRVEQSQWIRLSLLARQRRDSASGSPASVPPTSKPTCFKRLESDAAGDWRQEATQTAPHQLQSVHRQTSLGCLRVPCRRQAACGLQGVASCRVHCLRNQRRRSVCPLKPAHEGKAASHAAPWRKTHAGGNKAGEGVNERTMLTASTGEGPEPGLELLELLFQQLAIEVLGDVDIVRKVICAFELHTASQAGFEAPDRSVVAKLGVASLLETCHGAFVQ